MKPNGPSAHIRSLILINKILTWKLKITAADWIAFIIIIIIIYYICLDKLQRTESIVMHYNWENHQ